MTTNTNRFLGKVKEKLEELEVLESGGDIGLKRELECLGEVEGMVQGRQVWVECQLDNLDGGVE